MLSKLGVEFLMNRADGEITLKVEMPENPTEDLFLKLIYGGENDPHAGALLLCQEFLGKPEESWLRGIQAARGSFVFVFGNNPKIPDGKDVFYLSYKRVIIRSHGKVG